MNVFRERQNTLDVNLLDALPQAAVPGAPAPRADDPSGLCSSDRQWIDPARALRPRSFSPKFASSVLGSSASSDAPSSPILTIKHDGAEQAQILGRGFKAASEPTKASWTTLARGRLLRIPPSSDTGYRFFAGQRLGLRVYSTRAAEEPPKRKVGVIPNPARLGLRPP